VGSNNEGSHNFGSHNVGSRNVGDFNLGTECIGSYLQGFNTAAPPALHVEAEGEPTKQEL
jgi:hypothetical protein